MYTCYQVALIAEDGEYAQADFQTERAAFNYIKSEIVNRGEGQHLIIKAMEK